MKDFVAAYLSALLSRNSVAIWILSGSVTTAAGPFGTFDGMALDVRAAFWFGIILVSMVIGHGIATATRLIWPGEGEAMQVMRNATLLTLFFAPLLVLITETLTRERGGTGMHPVLMALVVFLVPWAVFGLRHMILATRGGQDAFAGAADGAAGAPRLFRRLEGAPTVLRRISVRDHYVDVWTDAGTDTLLMRFSDAVDEADGVPGVRIHRSHWVAVDAVNGVEKVGQREFVVLKCGLRLPVSRSYQGAVAAVDRWARTTARDGGGTGRDTSGSPSRTA